MAEATEPESAPVDCNHAYVNYCIGSSELKGEVRRQDPVDFGSE